MASLAELPNLVGFFSYSREDDEDFRGELSAIRAAIGRNLAALLGRSKRQNFRLWQDVEAIAPGKLWETEIANAIEESVFFIPIVTPRAVQSPYCKSEFESFLARERALARNDLVFPILYLPVPALRDEAKRRNDRVLTIVAERQFVDWRSFRHVDVNATPFGQEIGRFCEKITEALHETLISPEERREREADARRRGDDEERARQEAVKDVTTASFRADVLTASTRKPVLVHFWAPWCGPCKQLAPALEKAVADSGSKVALVKMNIDDHPQIAGQLGIQSIPAVIAFDKGQPVDGFVGALPESQVREFIDRLVGSKSSVGGS